MDDDRDIKQVAEQLIAARGGGAYAYAREQAEVARDTGDRESAVTWWDIALAVVEIARYSGEPPSP